MTLPEASPPPVMESWILSESPDRPEEACGVFGVYAPGEQVGRLIYFGLHALQHRGQESAGIAVADGLLERVPGDHGDRHRHDHGEPVRGVHEVLVLSAHADVGARRLVDRVESPLQLTSVNAVTPDELTDPYNLEMTCTVERAGARIFSGSVNTSKLHRKFETLIEFLLRANSVPTGTVLLTGTGIIVPENAALAAGDVVSISIPQIGTLINRAAVVG